MSCNPHHEFGSPKHSTVDAEQEADGDPHHLIRQQKEDRRDDHHDEYHDGGHGGLLARRPRDLLRLGAHFLQELEGTEFCHSSYQIGISRPTLRTRPATPFLLGKMLAAEIRYRAAGDGSFLLPAGHSVKRQPKSACRAKPLAPGL